jgi:uncharacterized zinc-type alcohol dehydrogenase-like protein
MKKMASSFDLIIDTFSGHHDYNSYLGLLKTDGTMVLLGVPPQMEHIHAGSLIFGRRSLVGSLVGGIKETQEMLDFCVEHNIVSDLEVISIDKINEAYERTIAGHVHYLFVIDMAALKN